MAVTVTTDLSTGLIDDASSSATFVEPSGNGSVSGEDYGDMKAFQDEADVYIQGVSSVSGGYTTNNPQRGCLVTDAAAPVTIPTDGAVLVWQWWISPSALQAYATAGQFVAIGSGSSALDIFAVGGNNLDPAPLGGWYCYAVDPDSATPYEQVGSPGGTYVWFGGGIAATQQSRGLTHYCIDAIRYGRCTAVMTGGTPDGEFIDFSDTLQNAADGGGIISYGIFDNIAGAFYMQGLLQFGTDATSVSFTDSNQVINIRNTPAVGANFNRIEIRNASSSVSWTGCSFANLGTNNTVATTASRGDLEVHASAATVTITNCNFADMGTFIFGSGTTITGTAFRRCQALTANSATFTNCTFDNISVATANPTLTLASASDTSKVTDCRFTSTGTGYGLQIGATNGQTVNLTDLIFTNYSAYVLNAGSGTTTGNEALYFPNITSGQNVNLSISGGTALPSFRTGGGTVTFITTPRTITLTGVLPNSEIFIWDVPVSPADTPIDSTENLAVDGTTTDGGLTYSWSFTNVNDADTLEIKIYNLGYQRVKIPLTVDGSQSIPIQQTIDRNYLDPV